MRAEISEPEDLGSLEEEWELDSKFLVFAVGEKEFALKIRYIIEIVPLLPVTELPNMPDYILGIVNLRGRGIPVIDARIRFGIESIEYNEKTSIIVLQLDESYYGLIVDGVREVITIPQDSIEPAIGFKSMQGDRFVDGLSKSGENVKILLNIHKVIQV